MLIAVSYDDTDTDFVELNKEKYKIIDPASKGKSGTSSKSKADAAPSSQATAGSTQKQRERQRSVPPAAPSSGKPASASKASRPSSASAAADKAAGSQQPAAGAADKSAAAEKSGRTSADRSPSEKQSTDKAAAPTAGQAKESKGIGSEKERRSSSTGAAAAASKQAAAAAIAAANAAAGAANKKLPLLNMSHVSKKDREAARMLLGFSSPSGQEVRYSMATSTLHTLMQPASKPDSPWTGGAEPAQHLAEQQQ